jgi:uncharacterized membrane protein YgcG
MKTIEFEKDFSGPRFAKQSLAFLVSFGLLLATGPQSLAAAPDQDQSAQATEQTQQQGTPYVQQTPEQIQQLVAPIALYPDSLVAQILAASTFPEQVVEADRFVQQNPDLKGDALGQAVDKEPWDPSVKALTAFPSVLGNMDKNLSWTSSLGDAYYNQQEDVMNAVQFMRQKAQAAGNLKSTPQQVVGSEGSDITIAPAQPDVVYVPAYDPWLVYGYPVVAWPGWYPYPGIWYGGPSLFFGVGFGIGFFGGFGWGWGNWGFDWRDHYIRYGGGRYYSRSSTFYNRDAFYRGERGFNRGQGFDRSRGFEHPEGRAEARPFGGDNRAARGYTSPRGQEGTRSGAFSSFGRGGEERGFSSRGSSSFGGGARGGGGGRHR